MLKEIIIFLVLCFHFNVTNVDGYNICNIYNIYYAFRIKVVI